MPGAEGHPEGATARSGLLELQNLGKQRRCAQRRSVEVKPNLADLDLSR